MHSEACLNVLVDLRDHAESEQVRLAAAMAILDRAHGKPRQGLDLTKDEGITVIVDSSCGLPEFKEPAFLPRLVEGHNR